MTTKIAFLGDLILTGEWEKAAHHREAQEAVDDLNPVLSRQDLVFANLETTVGAGAGTISKEPRLISDRLTLQTYLKQLGVGVVTLANNHAFDALPAGFQQTRLMLDEVAIRWFGAGLDSAGAAEPLIVETNGMRFGWLGYAALDTRPSHVAGETNPGINVLDPDRANEETRKLSQEVDHVIVSLHWGVEYCHLPSPDQINLARSLIDCGARLVVGHHTHVIQGLEEYRSGLIAYNLGNATATDLYVGSRKAIRQTSRTRSSFVLETEFSKQALTNYRTLPIRSSKGKILVNDARAGRILEKANQSLSRGVSPAAWKRRRLYEDVFLRTLWKLDPRVLASVRPRHFANFFRNLASSLKGQGPA